MNIIQNAATGPKNFQLTQYKQRKIQYIAEQNKELRPIVKSIDFANMLQNG